MRSLMYIILLFVVLSSCAAKPEGANSAAISGRYTNPVLFNLADPCILLYDGTYYMSGTGDNVSYYIYTSKDLVNWSKGNRIFGPGSEKDFWAPDIFYSHSDKTFYLYYTVNYKIGVASSSTPDGEYKDLGILIKNSGDAQMFQDTDGSFYLYYSSNFTEIYVQPMSNPVTLKGSPKRLLTFDQGWDSPRNEAPWIFKRNNIYYLLYSGNNADLRNYAIGCATSQTRQDLLKNMKQIRLFLKIAMFMDRAHAVLLRIKMGNTGYFTIKRIFPAPGLSVRFAWINCGLMSREFYMESLPGIYYNPHLWQLTISSGGQCRPGGIILKSIYRIFKKIGVLFHQSGTSKNFSKFCYSIQGMELRCIRISPPPNHITLCRVRKYFRRFHRLHRLTRKNSLNIRY